MKKKEFKKPFNFVKRTLSQEEKERKFERAIDRNYRRIFGVKEESWENNTNKVKLLVNIGKKENNRAKELGKKEIVNCFFNSQKIKQYN